MTANVRHAAGSLLVVGVEGMSLSSLERAWLKLLRPGGVILFRRNITGAAQTRALLAEATTLCAPRALRCVDVEGGTVDRLRDALASMPAAQMVAEAAKTRPALAREHGLLIARGLKTFGFNVTLAPVLDLALPDSAIVMGTRSPGSTAGEVVSFAREFVAGLAAEGVAGCGKHFPGLGGGTRDSHFDTPSIQRPWKDLWDEDLAPYRALRDELPMIMVNHAAYPQTRGGRLPATSSPFWITTVLRKRIGYRGLIFSDDLEMGGILKFMPMEEAAPATLRAGMDMIEICHSPELILRAYESLVSEAERSAAFRKLLLLRSREAARKRTRIVPATVSKSLTLRQFEALQARILRFRETVLSLAGVDAGTSAQKTPKPVVETA